MTAMFRSRWMDWEKSKTSKVEGAKSPPEDSNTPKLRGAKDAKSPSGTFGTSQHGRFQSGAAFDTGCPSEQQRHDESNEISPVCLFCRQPVERGTPGTGALAGEDLHMDCYERFVKQGKGETS